MSCGRSNIAVARPGNDDIQAAGAHACSGNCAGAEERTKLLFDPCSAEADDEDVRTPAAEFASEQETHISCVVIPGALAADYPDHPVRLIVPSTPSSTPEGFAALIRAEITKRAKVIKDAGIQPE